MKNKNLSVILISTLLLIFLSACATKNEISNATTKKNGDESVTTSKQTEGQNKNQSNILYTINSEASLKRMYSTIDEFNESDAVETIVKGVITNVEYTYQSNLAYTILTLDVQDTYKGESSNVIKVYEDGGYVKLKDMKDSFKDASFTQEQLDKGLVDVRFFNSPHSKVGEEVVLYLTKNSEPLPIDSYRIVSSLYGKFVLDKTDGKYKRINLEVKDDSSSKPSEKIGLVTKFEKSILKNEMENKLKTKFKNTK